MDWQQHQVYSISNDDATSSLGVAFPAFTNPYLELRLLVPAIMQYGSYRSFAEAGNSGYGEENDQTHKVEESTRTPNTAFF